MSNYFKEVAEANETSETEKKKTSTAFENDKKADAKEVKRIHTINEQYEGKTYPERMWNTSVSVFSYHGEKIEGVFPQFEGKDREVLPRKLYEASDDQQFSYCTRALAKKIEQDPSLAKQFTPRQLEQSRTANLGYPV